MLTILWKYCTMLKCTESACIIPLRHLRTVGEENSTGSAVFVILSAVSLTLQSVNT